MMRADVRAACMRVMDAVMLEKIKQVRASDFKGLDLIHDAPTPGQFLELESEIANRYSASEFEKLKRYGFTGVNIEQRAKQSGLSTEYNIVYRNFSRNVHSTDFLELLLQEDPNLIGGDHNIYLEQRDRVCCELVLISVAGIINRINAIAALGLNEDLAGLSQKVDEVRQTRRAL